MKSRERILASVKQNQPERQMLPDIQQLTAIAYNNVEQQFCKVLEAIGGTVQRIETLQDITAYVKEHYQEGHRLVTTIPGIDGLGLISAEMDPHELETVQLAVISGVFGVAENGSIWLTENDMKVRVLPFICQHLAVVLARENIVQHMHEAYTRIASESYGFGVFIAGPSKTADIEQSLVLGAHGPAGMTVFLLNK
jgi:L-lactate dehydrogenase complex protein LldG